MSKIPSDFDEDASSKIPDSKDSTFPGQKQTRELKTGISNKVTSLVDFLTPISPQTDQGEVLEDVLSMPGELGYPQAYQTDLLLSECVDDEAYLKNRGFSYGVLTYDEIVPLVEVNEISVIGSSTHESESIHLDMVDEPQIILEEPDELIGGEITPLFEIPDESHVIHEEPFYELIESEPNPLLEIPDVLTLLSPDFHYARAEEYIVEVIEPKQEPHYLIEKYKKEIPEIRDFHEVQVLEEIIDLFDTEDMETMREEKGFFACMRDLYQEIEKKLQDVGFNYSNQELDVLLIQPQSILDETLQEYVLKDLRLAQVYDEVLKYGKGKTAHEIISTKLKEGFLEELTYISIPLLKVNWMLPNDSFLVEDMSTDTPTSEYENIVSADFSGSDFERFTPDTVENIMSRFIALNYLNLSHSSLGGLTPEMWQAIFSISPQLRILDLSHNHLQHIQQQQLECLFSTLKKVRILKINDNQLNTWSPEMLQLFFSHCWNLYKLDISGNDLSQLSPTLLKFLFSHLSRIRSLKATDCGLTKIQLQNLFCVPPHIIIG